MSLPFEKKKRKKKGKYKKNSQHELQLKKDDLEFLTFKTKYSSDEIIEWHRSGFVDKMWFILMNVRLFSSGFIDDNPDGLLTKVKMLDMYSQGNMSCFYDSHTVGSNSFHSVRSVAKANMFVDSIFSKYDTDNDGHIDFKVKYLLWISNLIER